MKKCHTPAEQGGTEASGVVTVYGSDDTRKCSRAENRLSSSANTSDRDSLTISIQLCARG